MSSKSALQNRLAKETSPYLLQHAANPVDWYPWGPEALERAKELQRPIFLSIGYSACHWCHVMERESFEDPKIAELLNRGFVAIKVDREERPDLDDIYMKAVQALSGAGGWPMSVFLTPELQPFFGGTYFPPDDRYGRPGFPKILRWVEKLWSEDRERVLEQAKTMTGYITAEASMESVGDLDPGILDHSLRSLESNFDSRWGGFGAAPKFPHALDLRLLLRHGKRTGDAHATEMALSTLDRMAQGGIYDQLGGGFARYSTDEKWLIPHFEKMLYDNALLVPAYLEAFLVTREERFARIARETCAWVLGEMVTAEGGFASSLDADSEGEEGKFYAWTQAELDLVLGAERGAQAAAWFGVTEAGNFEHGKNALWRPKPDDEVAKELEVELEGLRASMETARAELLRSREQRVRPGKDDKVLAAWNGLMISALSQAYQVLAEPRFLDAARRAGRHLLEKMRQPDGRLFATARGGRAHVNACLDDYAFVIQGLIDLFESDFDPAWLREALALDRILAERFADEERGGYFTTGTGHEQLIARLRSPVDGALPSGNGVQALNLLRLSELTGDGERAVRAEKTLRSVGALANRYPQGFSQLLLAVDHLAAGPREIVIAGADEDVERMLAVVRSTFLPQRVVARAHPGADAELVPLLAGKEAPAGNARAFVCRNYACGVPARTPEELARQLAS